MDLNPWLSSVYVLPDYRNIGIGSMLITSVINKSKELSFDKLYLFASASDTFDIDSYYARRKWIVLDDCTTDNDGNPAKIFYYSL